MTQQLETLPAWTSPEEVAALAEEYGTPNYFYFREALQGQADEALSLGAPFGLTVRFAMKANPHPEVLSVFRDAGLHIDASSGKEAIDAIDAGFEPEKIMLTTQLLPPDSQFEKLIRSGVLFNATSLGQLKKYGTLFPGSEVCVRINPSIGSGMNNRTTTGGVSSSFGIWHEYIPDVHRVASEHDLQITKVHTHIGSGTDPDQWQIAAEESLAIVEQFPLATKLNLGGGFKVARMSYENSADMTAIGERLEHLFKGFARHTGRELGLEIEPGTFLVANTGILVGEVSDKKDTGEDGYTFVLASIGMKDNLRPSMYGAQHPIVVVRPDGTLPEGTEEVVVVGPNCESGDILTPAEGDPELLAPRLLGKSAVGDLLVMGGVGAYGRTMAPDKYNGHPVAGEHII